MNKLNSAWPLWIAVVLLLPDAAAAADFDTNRFTLSARFGLNISARFGSVGAPALANPRLTPGGDLYNYDNGYVLSDISGNAGGQTWYWGYDDSASQVSGNTILLSRSTPAGNLPSPSFGNDPQYGAELTYNRLLGEKDTIRYGVEAAVNYLSLGLSDNSTFNGSLMRVTDAFPFTPGTTPPQAPPAYQGSFNGPGFVIGDTPVSSTPAVVSGATVTDRRRFDADLWGFRLGPYLEIPLGERLNLSFSGGLAVGVLDCSAGWEQTFALTGGGSASTAGSGHDSEVLWGGFVGANVRWEFRERWSVVGGAQYQNLGHHRHTFGGREVEVDLSQSVFLTVGLSYHF